MCTINVGDNNYCHLQKDIFYKVFILIITLIPQHYNLTLFISS